MIRVIGAGWYGCHAAKVLAQAGYPVVLVDRNRHLFSGASRANQSRLHLGFHYPRSAETRSEARASARAFEVEYGEVLRTIPSCVYAVAHDISLIDYVTYRDIMLASGVQLVEIDANEFGLANCEGAMLTAERMIDQDAAVDHFARNLAALRVPFRWDCVDADSLAAQRDEFGITVDCTYGAFGSPFVQRYEPCFTFKLLGPRWLALTIMDGPHGVSVYPYGSGDMTGIGTCTITSVKDTPCGRFDHYAEAALHLDEVLSDPDALLDRFNAMRAALHNFAPRLSHLWGTKYIEAMPTIRALPGSLADSRRTIVTEDEENQIVHVLPGKISAVQEITKPLLDSVRKWEMFL